MPSETCWQGVAGESFYKQGQGLVWGFAFRNRPFIPSEEEKLQ